MPDPTFPDEWLAHSLEGVLSAERLAELRAKATPERTLWETLVAEKIASDDQILSALSTRFRLKLADVSTIDPKVREAVPDELVVSEAEASQRPVVRLVDLIISEGILSRSSDIHIEPEEGGVAVRYRIDGVLRQVMKIPRAAGLPLISRIKIMSQLDI